MNIPYDQVTTPRVLHRYLDKALANEVIRASTLIVIPAFSFNNSSTYPQCVAIYSITSAKPLSIVPTISTGSFTVAISAEPSIGEVTRYCLSGQSDYVGPTYEGQTLASNNLQIEIWATADAVSTVPITFITSLAQKVDIRYGSSTNLTVASKTINNITLP